MSNPLLLDDILACPVDGGPLSRVGDEWVSAAGRRYPSVLGVPVLFRPNSTDTLSAMAESRRLSEHRALVERDPYCIDSLGLSDGERTSLRKAISRGTSEVDPVVEYLVGATCGTPYASLVGRLPRYPIPDFRLSGGSGGVLVDLGCNWGRWCIAAGRNGFLPIGIDPQIGAVLAARRVARQLGIEAHFICADARSLPLRAGVADTVFSYSVLQHLDRQDVIRVVGEVNRVLTPGGRLLVQMPNVMGARCFYQWARRGCTDGAGFNVRYWTLSQLRNAFGTIGPVNFEIDCFFGIGLQPSDADLMPQHVKGLLKASEQLRKLGRTLPGLTWISDSVYVKATKPR